MPRKAGMFLYSPQITTTIGSCKCIAPARGNFQLPSWVLTDNITPSSFVQPLSVLYNNQIDNQPPPVYPPRRMPSFRDLRQQPRTTSWKSSDRSLEIAPRSRVGSLGSTMSMRSHCRARFKPNHHAR